MKSKNDKKYDLEERTFNFVKNVIEYVRNLPKGIADSEIGKQLVRSADSGRANYIEANESLSKKDFSSSEIYTIIKNKNRKSGEKSESLKEKGNNTMEKEYNLKCEP